MVPAVSWTLEHPLAVLVEGVAVPALGVSSLPEKGRQPTWVLIQETLFTVLFDGIASCRVLEVYPLLSEFLRRGKIEVPIASHWVVQIVFFHEAFVVLQVLMSLGGKLRKFVHDVILLFPLVRVFVLLRPVRHLPHELGP